MPSSPLQALVYCNDAQSLCTIDRVCSETDIASDVCLTSSAALKSLKNKRFDLLVLDFDDPGAVATTAGGSPRELEAVWLASYRGRLRIIGPRLEQFLRGPS